MTLTYWEMVGAMCAAALLGAFVMWVVMRAWYESEGSWNPK